jgi:hypothetical protein
LQALEDPFGLKKSPTAACIPDLHAVPSKKTGALHRGNFSTGTAGYGFVLLKVHQKTNDVPVASEGAVTFSEAAWGGAAGSFLPTPSATPATGLSSIGLPKLPYSNAEFAATAGVGGIQGRVVGAGLRIRYIGPELARGGQINAVRHPENNSLVGLTLAEIKTFTTSKSYPVDREWTYINYQPTEPDEYKYSSQATTSNGIAQWNMGFVITGTTTSTGTPGSAPFEFEVVQFIEYIGRINNITTTHVDVQAMSMIRNATEMHPSTRSPTARVLKSLTKIGADHMINGSANANTSPALRLSYRGNDKKEPGIIANVVSDIVGKKAEQLMEAGVHKLGEYGSKALTYAKRYLPSWAVEMGEGLAFAL